MSTLISESSPIDIPLSSSFSTYSFILGFKLWYEPPLATRDVGLLKYQIIWYIFKILAFFVSFLSWLVYLSLQRLSLVMKMNSTSSSRLRVRKCFLLPSAVGSALEKNSLPIRGFYLGQKSCSFPTSLEENTG
jgi:hypothetical protein